jgi:hypothetical protein
MKKLIFISILLTGYISVMGQISLVSDSMIVSKWDISKGGNIPTLRVQENMSIEIDKDLLALVISGRTKDMAYIEKAYLIDFIEANYSKDKWLFQGSDKNCIPCTITLDLNNKKISFITIGKEYGIDRPVVTIYYTIVDVKMNNDAIEKHLREKGDKKY